MNLKNKNSCNINPQKKDAEALYKSHKCSEKIQQNQNYQVK